MRSFPNFLVIVAIILFLGLSVSAVGAQEYIVQSGYESPVPGELPARTPVPVGFFALPFWVMLAQFLLFPPELFLAAKLWTFMGIRRVSGVNVLNQDSRARIFEYIRLNPGIHLRALSLEMGMKMGTLRYHLNVLRHMHKIAVSEDPATVRFYENSGTYSGEEQQIHKHLRNETTRKILTVLLHRPLATRKDIADAVGVSGPSVSWHMKRLEEDRIIIPRREGRTAVYEIPEPVNGYLSRQIHGLATSGIPDYGKALGQA